MNNIKTKSFEVMTVIVQQSFYIFQADVIFDARKVLGFSVKDTFHSYIRLDPLHGMDVILNLQTIFTGKVGKGIENFYYTRQFTGN